jgi:thiol-disulfide isomerase/thioredoxin
MNCRTRMAAIAAGCAAVIALGVLYGIGKWNVHAGLRPPAVLNRLLLVPGQPAAPQIGFVDDTGKKLNLSDFRGRYVLVNLWATWCGPCINELPELARLQQALPKDRFVVAPVDVLERLDAGSLHNFLQMHSADSLPVYIDSDRQTQQAFIANELPLTVLIDSNGREVARAAGGQKWADPASVAWMKSISSPPLK